MQNKQKSTYYKKPIYLIQVIKITKTINTIYIDKNFKFSARC